MARLSPEQVARNKEIDRLRQEWGVQEPELHVMPAWLRRRVYAAIKRGELSKPGYSLDGWSAVQHAIQCINDFDSGVHGDWFDHAGRLKLDGGTFVLVAEPYQLSDSSAKHLNSFCRILDLEFQIESQSWWFPGKTLRIVISEKKSGANE